MHWLVAVLLIVVLALCVYVWAYHKVPGGVEIHQTSLENFRLDLLFAKQPIVLDDRVVKLADLSRLWFASNITRDFRLDGSETWHKNRFKYLIMHAEQEGDVYMYPANRKIINGVPDPQQSLLAMHLLPGQVMILPFRWNYLVMQPMCVGCLGIHDYITYMLP